MISTDQWKALGPTAAAAVVFGAITAAIAYWKKTSPMQAAAVEVGWLGFLVMFSVLMAWDTRRMRRDRLEIERKRLAFEEEQIGSIQAALPQMLEEQRKLAVVLGLARAAEADARERALIERQVDPRSVN